LEITLKTFSGVFWTPRSQRVKNSKEFIWTKFACISYCI